MRKRLKPIFDRIAKPIARWYFSKPRSFSYKSVQGKVLPDVFHPQFTISTKLLMDFIEPLDLQNKSVLELGCGTGFISVLAAKKGANVLATDINPKALKNAQINANLNQVEVEILRSDLFQDVPNQQFDYIIINPPYYPKKPKNVAEEAWFCGENFEYFKKLFSQLPEYFNKDSKVFIILSEDCEITTIKSLAESKFMVLKIVESKKVKGETSHIYSIFT